jgi:hypothetical protein
MNQFFEYTHNARIYFLFVVRGFQDREFRAQGVPKFEAFVPFNLYEDGLTT